MANALLPVRNHLSAASQPGIIDVMGILFWFPGVILFLVGWIGLLVAAFRVHILWGLLGVCVQPLLLVFVIVHWDKAKNPAMLWFLGWILMSLGEFTSPRIRRWHTSSTRIESSLAGESNSPAVTCLPA